MELRHRPHEPGEREHGDPTGEAGDERRPPPHPLREQPHRKRPGQRHRLHQQHEPDEGRRLELELLEGHARKLGNRRLHRAEHKHAAEQDRREVPAVVVGGTGERAGEGEEFARRRGGMAAVAIGAEPGPGRRQGE